MDHATQCISCRKHLTLHQSTAHDKWFSSILLNNRSATACHVTASQACRAQIASSLKMPSPHLCIAVTGHGISAEQLDAVFTQLKAAFAMPLEAKQAMIADENNRGWTPFAEETLDPEKQSKGDTKEGFYFGRWVSWWMTWSLWLVGNNLLQAPLLLFTQIAMQESAAVPYCIHVAEQSTDRLNWVSCILYRIWTAAAVRLHKT